MADCRKGGQILAATPGRLLDVMDSGTFDTKNIQNSTVSWIHEGYQHVIRYHKISGKKLGYKKFLILQCSNFHRFGIVDVSWQKSSQGEVSLERVTFFVLDEADRMLECGFEEQVGRIGRIHGRIFFESPGIWKASGWHLQAIYL